MNLLLLWALIYEEEKRRNGEGEEWPPSDILDDFPTFRVVAGAVVFGLLFVWGCWELAKYI